MGLLSNMLHDRFQYCDSVDIQSADGKFVKSIRIEGYPGKSGQVNYGDYVFLYLKNSKFLTVTDFHEVQESLTSQSAELFYIAKPESVKSNILGYGSQVLLKSAQGTYLSVENDKLSATSKTEQPKSIFTIQQTSDRISGLIVNKVNMKLSYGDAIKIQHINTKACLHSHELYYKTGSKRYQVTCFDGRDDNDWFIIEGATDQVAGQVCYNQIVRLRHERHGQYLYSTDTDKSPTTAQNEVSASCEGVENFNVSNSVWRIVPGTNVTDVTENVEANQPFRLEHLETDKFLHSHPFYFYIGHGLTKQQEVTCYPRNQDTNDDWSVFEVRGKCYVN
ncbi:stromal cell-derived factor 2-like protein [Acrasis kona]|uniref:Stromal cell-derived factor 2-like protein n=1 Tax=Acrasis kona TaxID=1008807 RepID=A0AAW2ZSN1_9EUKA